MRRFCLSMRFLVVLWFLASHVIDADIGRKEYLSPLALAEVWGTAPYLYDGRAVTIKEVVTKCNTGDKNGATSSLTEKQIDDLVEFVLSG